MKSIFDKELPVENNDDAIRRETSVVDALTLQIAMLKAELLEERTEKAQVTKELGQVNQKLSESNASLAKEKELRQVALAQVKDAQSRSRVLEVGTVSAEALLKTGLRIDALEKALAAKSSEAAVERQARQKLESRFTEFEKKPVQKPSKYKFDIQRNADGKANSVIAEVIH